MTGWEAKWLPWEFSIRCLRDDDNWKHRIADLAKYGVIAMDVVDVNLCDGILGWMLRIDASEPPLRQQARVRQLFEG